MFQKKNPHLYILIYGAENQTQRTPLIYDGKEHVNQNYTMIPMVYYCNHYYLVNDLSRLLSSQIRGCPAGKKMLFCSK